MRNKVISTSESLATDSPPAARMMTEEERGLGIMSGFLMALERVAPCESPVAIWELASE